ncbi:hypothetical protein C0581_00135 [Candidatus Parcubacteria bacterium]|nr:MAG: hypothetical protein C0581_00135 [Candidatus Parcubacteria bacterium]
MKKIVPQLFRNSFAYKAIIVVCLSLWISLGTFFAVNFLSAFSWSGSIIEDGAREYNSTDYDVGTGISNVLYGYGTGNGLMYFSYLNNTLGAVHFTYYNMAPSAYVLSSSELVEDQNSSSGRSGTSIALSGTTPVIAFEGDFNAGTGTSTLFYAIRNGSGSGNADDTDWNYYSITDAYKVRDVKLAITGSTYSITFYDVGAGAAMYTTCNTTCSDSGNWSVEVVDNSAALVGLYPSIAFTSSSVPVISYVDSTNADVKYAIRDGGGNGNDCTDTDWSCYVIDEGNGNYHGTSIAVNNADNVGILYLDSSRFLRYAYDDGGNSGCTGDETGTFTCESVSAAQSQYPTLKFNYNKPTISWYDVGGADLKYSAKYNGTWNTETPVSTNDVGSWSYLSVYESNVGIGYYDATDGEAMFYRSFVNFGRPVGSFNSAVQRTDGSGIVDISAEMDDPEDDDQVRFMIEYGSGVCGSTDLTLDETDSNTTADVGDPKIENDNDYEVGNSSGWILTSGGTNTIDFDWFSKIDEEAADGIYCVRMTTYDGNDEMTGPGSEVYTPPSVSLTLDNVDPTVPDTLTVNTTSTDSVVFNLTTSTDTNFAEYVIYYATSTPVTTSSLSLTSSTFSYFASSTWEGNTTTSLSGLTTNTLYYTNLWVYDDYGNTTSSASELSFYTLTPNPTNVATTSVAQTSANFSVDSFTNDSVGSSGYYFDLTVTAGGAAVSNSGWITSNTWSASGLTADTGYTIAVNYRNGDGVLATTSTLAFTTSAGAEEEDPAPTGGGGGGSRIPTGTMTINNDSVYTNSQDVTLYFSDVDANEYMASLESDFGDPNLIFSPVVDMVPYSLSEGDGEKFVYVRFKNQHGMFTADDSIILDTIAPDVPTIGLVDTGVEDGKLVRRPSVSGTAEPNGQVIITKVREGEQASASLWVAAATTHYASIDENGDWSFSFESFLDQGTYSLLVRAEDSAGNVSESAPAVKLIIEGEDPPEEDPPPTEDDPEDDPPEEDPGDEDPPGEDDPGQDPPPGEDNPGGDQPQDPTEPSGGTNETEDVNENPAVETPVDQPVVETPVDEIDTPEIVSEQVVETVADIKEMVTGIIDNEQVEEINEKVAVPVLATVAVANVATAGFGAAQAIAFTRSFFGQILLVFRRKKRKKWGVVYNGYTKRPIDLATVRLVDAATGKVIQSQVTDSQGRYFFSAVSGEYRLEISKEGFEGFCDHLRDVDEDSRYAHLYHGENFTISDEENDINYNIPFEPAGLDKPTIQIIRDKVKASIRFSISIIGLVASVISFVISPAWWIALLICVHIFFYLLFYLFGHKKLPGAFGKIISNKSNKSLGKVVVRVFDTAYNKLIDTAVSDRKGRYAILLGPSMYYATYEKPKYKSKKSLDLDFTSEHTQGQGGILTRDESLDPLGKVDDETS